MIWVYRTHPYEEFSIELVNEDIDDVMMLIDLFPNAIYFYAELTTQD